MKTTTKIHKQGNYDFYSAMQLEHFEHFAKLTGFDTGIDIEELFPYIKEAKILVELGAGYGRAIHFLLQKKFEGNIIAVERISRLLKHLESEFGNTVGLLRQDIIDLKLPNHADVVMWLWSGILELSPEEQEQSISKVYENLKPNGLLVIESPYKTVKFVGELKKDQRVVVNTDWGRLEAYLPTENEIREYGHNAGFSSFNTHYYKSTTGLERVFYLLRK